VITKQPVLGEFSGKGDVTLGNYDLHRERAEINVPLGDTFAIRASAQNYGHDALPGTWRFPTPTSMTPTT